MNTTLIAVACALCFFLFSADAEPEENCRTIEKGDTCRSISISCGNIGLDALYKNNPFLNGGQDCEVLQVGTTICCQGNEEVKERGQEITRGKIQENWNSGNDGQVKWQFNCDFNGPTNERLPSSGENCGGLCIASPICTHFRYSDDGFCSLKTLPPTNLRIYTNGGVCGILPFRFAPEIWNSGEGGVKWLLNCDFFGNDIGNSVATGEQCGGLCIANPECNHFRHTEGTCYLKKAPLTTPRTPISGGMCGYVPFRDLDASSTVPPIPVVLNCPTIGGLESKCRPIKDCAVWYDSILATPHTACTLAEGCPGACCPDIPANSYGAPLLERNAKNVEQYISPIRQQPYNSRPTDPNKQQQQQQQFTTRPTDSPKQQQCQQSCQQYNGINTFSVNSAAEVGRLQMTTLNNLETQLFANNIFVIPGSARATHALVFTGTTESEKLSREAIIGAYAVSEIVKRYQIKPEDVESTLKQFNLKDTILSAMCITDPPCDERTIRSPYRTLDGSCNNVDRPSWGKSITQFQRVLPSAYADGVRIPRRAKSGGQLPSARLVSTTVTRDVDSPSETVTTWVMQYGQFLDHDFTRTPEFKMANSSSIPCCMPNGKFIAKELVHPECFPIEIPVNDPFFSKFGQRCMPLVRSAPIRRSDCIFGATEQTNQLTHFLDQSNVYGFDNRTARELRTFLKGALKVTPRNELDLLPPDENSQMSCTLSKNVSGVDPPADVKCFKTGDTPRVNEHPNLAVTHTVFLREHNRLAAELGRLNPAWDDERLYQEARRILTAQMQHITYNEWLPIVIGRVKMQQLGLLPLQKGFSQDYDKNLNPSILNEFAGAAFRFGHTLIQGKHHLTNRLRIKEREILLRQHFFKTQEIYTPGNLDKFLIGLASQPSQNAENYFTQEVTNHLFEEEGKGFGLDLVALNLQRGRDHGIASYNSYRTLCGLPRANQFKDLLDLIPSTVVDGFAKLYASVDDIDLFIGSISERLAPGALVGPTFQCIIADQFLKLKRGDRYFYDLGGQAGSFTEQQLTEIRKASFARLVCDNSNSKFSQPLTFKTPSVVNPLLNCDSPSIPRLNLGQFAVEDRWPNYNTGDGGVKWHENCDFPGYDLSRKTVPGDQCGRLCINDNSCNAFTYNSVTGICFLKNIPASLGRSPWDKAICGFLPWKF